MERTLLLDLNQFPTIPHSLRVNPSIDAPRTDITVNLASLYHHYYLDSHGRTPPDPDPAQFEHLQFLLPMREFRLRGDGIGVSTLIRRNRSSELGQAFCRWFLHDHLNITYFAHMEHVLDRMLHPAFGSLRVERVNSGDVPDYFCAESADRVYLAEAKGRYSSISFGNKEFGSWRDQFGRIEIRDSSGHSRKVKGYIVATRYATEANSPRLKSTIFVEDPESPGDRPLSEKQSQELGSMIIAAHYSKIAQKLGQPVLASALYNGFRVPGEIQFPAVVWEFQVPPLKGMRFVGGYYTSADGSLPLRQVNGRISFASADPFRLDVGRGTFFGVEEYIFRQMATLAREGFGFASEIRQFEKTEPFYSGISILRDGSIISPLDFLTPVEQTTF